MSLLSIFRAHKIALRYFIWLHCKDRRTRPSDEYSLVFYREGVVFCVSLPTEVFGWGPKSTLSVRDLSLLNDRIYVSRPGTFSLVTSPSTPVQDGIFPGWSFLSDTNTGFSGWLATEGPLGLRDPKLSPSGSPCIPKVYCDRYVRLLIFVAFHIQMPPRVSFYSVWILIFFICLSNDSQMVHDWPIQWVFLCGLSFKGSPRIAMWATR